MRYPRLLRVPLHMFLIQVAAMPAMADESGWLERVDPAGDFRLRYEWIDREGLPEQDRYRYRLRIGADIRLYDDVNFVVQLATAADNPISRNVTFGGNELDDEFGVDLAYVDWQALEALDVLAGKMKNPMFHPGGAQLVYDNDLNPGAVALTFSPDTWFVNAMLVAVHERVADDDSMLYHVQAGAKLPIGADLALVAGAGFLEYTNTVGNLPFVYALPAGNTVDADGRYVYEYADVEVFAQLDTSVGELPVRLFAHYVDNVKVSEEDTAYVVGVHVGDTKLRGDWKAGWHYKDVGADAVVGSFTESDFAGGGTDVEGHSLGARYALRAGLTLGGTLFLNEAGEHRGSGHNYRRLQLDLEYKFD